MSPEEEHQHFFHALGRAIATWQDVEIGLFAIFEKLVRSPNYLAISAAFHSIISLQGKLSMTDAAAHYTLEDKHLEQWKSLHKKIGQDVTKRNELVHFMVIRFQNHPEGERLLLQPNIFDAKRAMKYRAEQPPTYNLEQLDEIMKSFGTLGQELQLFARELDEKPSPEKSR